MPSIKERAQRAWNLYGHLQRAVGVPRMLVTLSYGAAVIVSLATPLPWYWKVTLFLGVAASLSVIVAAMYVTVFYERFDRTRRLRNLFAAAGARLRASATRDYKGDLKEVIGNEFLALKCDILVFSALKHWAAVDYDDFVNVAEWRAMQAEEKLNKPLLKANYLRWCSFRVYELHSNA